MTSPEAIERIENQGSNEEPFLRCPCGNTPSDEGFMPCGAQGQLLPAGEGSTHLRCADCGRFFAMDDLLVLGRIHVGQIVRQLRQAANRTRRHFAKEARIAEAELTMIERGRRSLSEPTRSKLLAHPAMSRLPSRAQEAGLGRHLKS